MIRSLTFLAILATQSAALVAAQFVPQASITALHATIAQQQKTYIRPAIKLGIDVLADQQFAPLANKRIGLLTHPAGVNRFGVPSAVSYTHLTLPTTPYV